MANLRKTSGIYKIINLVNKKFYIGSTNNLYKRKNEHFGQLKRGCHCNSYLQKSFNKYKEENFKFKIIANCKNENLLRFEQFFIDKLEPDYNICKVAGTVQGRKASAKTLELKRIIMTGKIHKEESKFSMSFSKIGKYGNVMQYDKNMNLIKEWYIPITNIAKELNINRRAISTCLKNKSKSSGGYIWKFKNDITNE